MSEMRFNPITLDWVIMAPERALKPNDFLHQASVPQTTALRQEDCPFCAGNEHLATPEICRATGPDGSWLVRVVPNKYPAFDPGTDLRRTAKSTFRSMAAAGAHEVVIEHPQHALPLSVMTAGHLGEILRIYRSRYQALRQVPGVESIVIFKNQGERAGSSLRHSHSQITAAPVLSSQVCMRLQEARRYYELNGVCLYCQVLNDELEAKERLLETGSSFAAFVPYASLSPYHIWIFPVRHASSFDSITDPECDELAGLLSRQLRRLSIIADHPDYNLIIRSAPVSECDTHFSHWYLAIIPRVSHLAGFELGSGTYINSLRPELSAELLRNAPLE